jgi:hypothetical protein
MADTIQITEGSGTKIDTDEVTRNGQVVQQHIFKLSLGADGETTLLDSGQQLAANSIPVVLASDTPALTASVATNSVVVPVTPIISSGAVYAASDQIGGIITIAGALKAGSLSGMLTGISIVDKDKQNATISLLFFSSLPTVVSVDNGIADIADSELASKFIGSVVISSLDYVSLLNASVASRETGITLQGDATTIYAVAIIHAAATYTSTSGLIFRFHIQQD